MTDLPTYPLTVDGITAVVRTLDHESWELAERLSSAGVKGIPGNECACPIARHLQLLLPPGAEVFVEAEIVRVNGTERDSSGCDLPVTVSVSLPDGAQDLVQEFDRGEWPELIEKTEEVSTDVG